MSRAISLAANFSYAPVRTVDPFRGVHHQSAADASPEMARRPYRSTLRPSGDHTGSPALARSAATGEIDPPVIEAVNARRGASTERGASHGPVQNAIDLPSGENRGALPSGAKRRGSPPRVVTT